MSEWSWTTIGDLTCNFDSLRRPVKSSDRLSGEVPYYGASGIIDWVAGYTHDGEYLLIAEDGENLRSRNTPIAFMSRGKSWVNNHAHVVTGNHRSDTRFLEYLLAVTDVLGYLTGSAQPKLSRSSLDSIAVRVPSLSEQQAIAEVLGALDDKIAANNGLNAIISDLMVSLLTPYPTRRPLSEIVVHRKKSTNPETILDKNVAHFSLPAFDTDQCPEVCDPASIKSNKFSIEKPSVLISKLNPRFPRIWDVATLPNIPALASTEFLVLEPKEESTAVIWAVLSQPSFSTSLESQVSGTSSSHQRVKPDDLLATLVPDPSSIPTAVRRQISALGSRVATTRIENITLTATRDTLLPQLMSGKLRVKDAEKVLEEASV
jgi:hypothetical protein